MPVYNAEEFLSDAIESVINQTYTQWELICIDNGSSDRSNTIIKNYKKIDERIKPFRFDENTGGPARPRNYGIDIAIGEYICFLDADDIWEKDKCLLQMKFMEINGYNFSSTRHNKIDKSGVIIKTTSYDLINNVLFIGRKNIRKLFYYNFIITSSVMIKKLLIGDLRFDDDPLLVPAEDLFLWLFLFDKKECKYGLLKNKLVNYRYLDFTTVERNNVNKSRTRRNYCFSKFVASTKNYNYLKILYKVSFLKYLKNVLKMS